MELSRRATTQAKQYVRQELVHEARMDRAIEANCDAYRGKMTQIFSQVSRSERPRTILAEGDSWFRYIVRDAIPTYLDQDPLNEVLNLASPGDEVRDMLSAKQLKRLTKVLKRGPTRRRKFDAFIFSGGGNDLLGQGRFRRWLHDYQAGMDPSALINRKALGSILDIVENGYREIISLRDRHSPTTMMYLHSYDFAQPSGEGVCGKGPWLKPSLTSRGVPAGMQFDVVKSFLETFKLKIYRIARTSNNVRVVPTQGTLNSSEWANEIHPKARGFRKIASKFAFAINQDFPRP